MANGTTKSSDLWNTELDEDDRRIWVRSAKDKLGRQKITKSLEAITDEIAPGITLPQTREVEGEFSHTAEVSEPLKIFAETMIDTALTANLNARATPDGRPLIVEFPRFAIEKGMFEYKSEGSRQMLAPSDPSLDNFEAEYRKVLRETIRDDESWIGTLPLFTTVISKLLQKKFTLTLKRKKKIFEKSGNKGVFSAIMSIGGTKSEEEKNLESFFTLKEDEQNHRIYLAAKSLRKFVNGLTRQEVKHLQKVNPYAVQSTFSKDKNGGHVYSDSLVSLLIGAVDDEYQSNGINPWLYFNEDISRIVPEHYRKVIEENYGQRLTPEWIRAIEKAFAIALDIKSGNKNQEKNQVNLTPPTREYLLNKSNRDKKRPEETNLEMLLDDSNVHAALNEHMKKSVKNPKEGISVEQREELNSVLSDYRNFMHDLKVFKNLKSLQNMIDVNDMDMSEGDGEDTVVSDEFTGWLERASARDSAKRVYSFTEDKAPIQKEIYRAIITGDLAGSTQVNTDLKNQTVSYVDSSGATVVKKGVDLMSPDEMKERQKVMLGELVAYASQMGLEMINTMQGDAIILSADTVADAAYFNLQAQTKLKKSIQRKLDQVEQSKITDVDDELAKLKAKVSYLKTQKKSVSKEEKQLDDKLLELARLTKRQELLPQYPVLFRFATHYGKFIPFPGNAIGGDINFTVDATKHEKYMDVTKPIPYKIALIQTGEKIDLNNKVGDLYSDAAMEDIKLRTKGLGYQEKSVSLGERSVTIARYTDLHGKDMVYRTLSDTPVKLGDRGSTRIWQLLTDEGERQSMLATLKYVLNPIEENKAAVVSYDPRQYFSKDIDVREEHKKAQPLQKAPDALSQEVSRLLLSGD